MYVYCIDPQSEIHELLDTGGLGGHAYGLRHVHPLFETL